MKSKIEPYEEIIKLKDPYVDPSFYATDMIYWYGYEEPEDIL